MKISSVSKPVYSFLLLLMCGITNFAIAQGDSNGSSSTSSSSRSITTTSTKTWYGEPWMWIVGAIVVLVIIALLARNNSSETRTTVIRSKD